MLEDGEVQRHRRASARLAQSAACQHKLNGSRRRSASRAFRAHGQLAAPFTRPPCPLRNGTYAQDLELRPPARGLDRDGIAAATADEGAPDRRHHRHATVADIGLDSADKVVLGDLGRLRAWGAALRLLVVPPGAEADAALLLGLERGEAAASRAASSLSTSRSDHSQKTSGLRFGAAGWSSSHAAGIKALGRGASPTMTRS
jgi:hypothetical protein